MRADDLRDRLSAWARPVGSAPPPSVEVIARRAGRRARRVAAVIASVAATCGVVALALLGVTGGGGHEHARTATGTAWQPPGRLPGPGAGPASAPFFVLLDLHADPAVPVVYAVSRRDPRPRQVATVPLPGRHVTLTGVTAAADDRTFLLTGTTFRHGSLVTRYYELRLGRDVRAARLMPLRIGVTARPEGGHGFIALSPDGTELAVAAQSVHAVTIAVVSLTSGGVRTWAAPGHALSLGSLSWVNDRRLAFAWAPGRTGTQIRVLDAASAGGSLMTWSRLLVPPAVRFGRFTGLANAPITGTGRAIFALMSVPLRPPPGSGTRTAVVEFSARTGSPERMITQSAQVGMGSFCGLLWADRSGRQVVTSCGYRLGSARDGRFSLWSDRTFWYNLKYVPFAW